MSHNHTFTHDGNSGNKIGDETDGEANEDRAPILALFVVLVATSAAAQASVMGSAGEQCLKCRNAGTNRTPGTDDVLRLRSGRLCRCCSGVAIEGSWEQFYAK